MQRKNDQREENFTSKKGLRALFITLYANLETSTEEKSFLRQKIANKSNPENIEFGLNKFKNMMHLKSNYSYFEWLFIYKLLIEIDTTIQLPESLKALEDEK